jgi:hypothetical protein
MNLEDYARLNKINGYFSGRIPGIKIIDSTKEYRVVENFRHDLELFNSVGGNSGVERVLFHDDCFVSIQQMDNGTPVVYYFATCLANVDAIIEEMKGICSDLGIDFQNVEVV